MSTQNIGNTAIRSLGSEKTQKEERLPLKLENTLGHFI